MRITRLSIHNYKSLKAASISPGPLTVLVGANASGKSNFADLIDFVSDIYRHGLDLAIGRKGGYENIAFRKMRRSKSAISVELCLELFPSDFSTHYRVSRRRKGPQLKVEHSFAFVARGSSIRAAYQVTKEHLVISTFEDDGWSALIEVLREGDVFTVRTHDSPDVSRSLQRDVSKRLLDVSYLQFFKEHSQTLPPTELVVGSIGRFVPSVYAYVQAMEGIRVFQISPTKTREFGVPTPTPELERMGGNLPAVIDMMQKQHRGEWQELMQIMRNILPSLLSIDVDYTSSRTLGLFFKEDGFGRPWSVDEVSDGTIQTLALLVAIFNPASTALVIEEPENSVHPWIIRHVVEACRDAAKRKQILITTHSPIVMNAVRPEEVWVIWRARGESHMAELIQLDSDFLPMWQCGEVPTFEYIDSGALAKALPPAPSTEIELEDL